MDLDEEPKVRPNLLPVGEILVASFKLPAQRAPKLLRAALPLILVIIGGLLVSFLFPGNSDDEPSGIQFLLFFVLGIVAVGCLILTIVGFHRVYLFKDETRPISEIIRWSSREWRFLGWSIAVGFLTTLVMMPFLFLAVPIFSMLDFTF